MNTVEIICAGVALLPAALVIFLFIRNKKVSKFRIMIIQEDFEASIKNIDNDISERVNNYILLPSYTRMVFSFKPLKKKYWL